MNFTQDPGTVFLLLYPSSPSSPPPVLHLLSAALRAHVEATAAAAAQEPAARPSRFHSITAPLISVEAYVERLFKYFKCSPVCLVMAFAYVQRLAQADPVLRPSRLNVHRMLCTGVTIAAKFTDDKFFTNRYYAQVGGIGLEELNRLELELLQRLGYRAHVDVPELCACLAHIQGAAAGGAAWAAEHPSVCCTSAYDPLEEAAPCYLSARTASTPACTLGCAAAAAAAAEPPSCTKEGCGAGRPPPPPPQQQQRDRLRAATLASAGWACTALIQREGGVQGQRQEEEGEVGDCSMSSSGCSSPHTPRAPSDEEAAVGALPAWAHDSAAFLLAAGMGCGRQQAGGAACREAVAVNAA